MSTLTSSSIDIPYTSEKLDSAMKVVLKDRYQDWMDKITILQGYCELSPMSPEQDYGPIVRRAARDLDIALRRHSWNAAYANVKSSTALLTFITEEERLSIKRGVLK